MDTDRVAALFDDWATQGRAEGMERGHGQTAGPLMEALEVGPDTHFLDLGCGNGWAARAAARRGAKAVGIDASSVMVERATETAVSQGLDTTSGGEHGAEFHVGDFTQLDLPDDAFDVVWSMEALYYAHDPDAVLREVRRVLKPGGVFHMVIDHYTENKDSHTWADDVGVPMVLRSEAEWVAAFEAAGLHAEASRLRSQDPADEAWKREQGSLHVVGR